MRVQKRRRRGRRSGSRAAALAALASLAALTAAAGCALGPEQEPGCHDDDDCGAGFTCRAGACFRVTTETSPPSEADAAADG